MIKFVLVLTSLFIFAACTTANRLDSSEARSNRETDRSFVDRP